MVKKLLLLGILVGALLADQRHFVWTYEAFTLPRGDAELELYQTYPGSLQDATLAMTLQQELEIGMTDRFDVGLYQVLRQEGAGSLRLQAYKLRLRHRVLEPGRFLLDPVVYLELKQPLGEAEREVEFKLILGREMSGWRIALNSVVERKFQTDFGKWEFKQLLAAGKQLGEHWHLGAETSFSGDGFRLGPTVAHGGEHLWSSLGVWLPAGEKKDPEWRLILGIGI